MQPKGLWPIVDRPLMVADVGMCARLPCDTSAMQSTQEEAVCFSLFPWDYASQAAQMHSVVPNLPPGRAQGQQDTQTSTDPCPRASASTSCHRLSRSHHCCLSRQDLQGSLITQQSLSQDQAPSAHLADCQIGGLFMPRPTSALPLHMNWFGNGQSLVELKFELDTRLTVLCVIAVACAYGHTAVSIVLNSVLLAFVNAIVLLAILFV